MQSKRTRIDKWDNYKLILISLVVIGHLVKAQLDVSETAKQIYWFIYLFHMPAFIMTSGMFAKRAIRERQYEKVMMFILLFFMIRLFMFLNRMIMGDRISISWSSVSGVEWYALAVGVYYLFTMFLKKFDQKQMLCLVVIVGCVAGYDRKIGDTYALARIITFYPFFLIGYYLKSEMLLEIAKKKWVKVLAAVVILAAIGISICYIDEIYWTIDLLKGNCSYRIFEKSDRMYAVFWRLGQYLVTALLVAAVFVITPARKFRFSYIGRNTLPIYALHYIVIDLFYHVFRGTERLMKISETYYVFLLIPIGIFLVWLLSLKPFVRLVNWLIRPRVLPEYQSEK